MTVHADYTMPRKYIYDKLAEYNIKYDTDNNNQLRIYDNSNGFHPLRFEKGSQVSIDGRLLDRDAFEKTLYNLKIN